jgi:hypothetical protein
VVTPEPDCPVSAACPERLARIRAALDAAGYDEPVRFVD